jgi:glycerol-3-phosphate acyltransferase PlsY
MGLKDPRSYGSGNPGATNVLRSGSKPAAILTLLLDALKGFVPVLLVRLYGAPYGLDEGTLALVALAAFVGHLWPVFFRFKGGKGVATAAGVLLAINPWLGVASLATFLIIAFFTRYASLASIISAVFAPLYELLIWGGGPIAAAVTAMGALLIWRHAGNIQKLIKGTENRIGQRSAGATVSASHATKRKPTSPPSGAKP